MKKEDKNLILSLGIVLLAIIIVVAGVFIYSGMNRPLTVIESGSMEHYEESKIGVIDTGDMVLMVNKDKTSITTYVDSYESGYSKFGNYGDVIIYHRTLDKEGKIIDNNRNPIIHRAILWMDYNGDQTWSAPSLKNYPHDLWEVSSGYDSWNAMSGTLTIKGFSDFNGGTYSASINLDLLSDPVNKPHSGYLTKGDNPYGSNRMFDQTLGITGVNGLVQEERIKAVAGIEIPWLGCIKLFFENNTSNIQGNSIPCLIVMIIDILMFFIVISTIIEFFEQRKMRIAAAEESKKPIRHAKRK